MMMAGIQGMLGPSPDLASSSKVMVLLNKDQKEKYLAYAEEMKNPKKSKADKKSKKESKKESEE